MQIDAIFFNEMTVMGGSYVNVVAKNNITQTGAFGCNLIGRTFE